MRKKLGQRLNAVLGVAINLSLVAAFGIVLYETYGSLGA
jgi:hypothetical protein